MPFLFIVLVELSRPRSVSLHIAVASMSKHQNMPMRSRCVLRKGNQIPCMHTWRIVRRRQLSSDQSENIWSFPGSDSLLSCRYTLLHMFSLWPETDLLASLTQPVSQRKYYLQLKFYAEIVLYPNRSKQTKIASKWFEEMFEGNFADVCFNFNNQIQSLSC